MAPDAVSAPVRERHVLLIEDAKDHAILFEEALALEPRSHFRVRHAGSLHAGLRLLREQRFDLIVSDLGLPDATGVTVVPILLGAAPRTPLVVLTGNADLETSLHAIELGAADYVRKGGPPMDTARILLQAIERHRLREKLERRTEDVQAFTYGLTHDLKSPLVTIDFLTQDLEEILADHPLADEARPVLHRIQHAVATADKFIRDILLFARADTETLRPRPVVLDNVVADVVADAAEGAARKELRLEQVPGGPEVQVRADPRTFPHLVENLVQNAVKFAPDHEGVVRVQVRRLDPGGARLEVHDNGPGVRPEDRTRIFKVFERADPGGLGREGHGVGLGIVQRIAERHGFRVDVDDSPLGGACFRVQMPHVPASPPWEKQPATRTADGATAPR